MPGYRLNTRYQKEQYGAGPAAVMQVGLGACTRSQRLMSYLDDSHFPGSQIVLRPRGGVICILFVASFTRNTLPRQKRETGSCIP